MNSIVNNIDNKSCVGHNYAISSNIGSPHNNSKVKVGVYVDCFNFYHSLIPFCSVYEHFIKQNGIDKSYKFKHTCDPIKCSSSKYKWYDYKKLSQVFLQTNENIEFVKLFTATPIHKDKAQQNRHKVFFDAQVNNGCSVIEGTFARRKEKKTDTNLVVEVIRDSAKNTVDNVILMSNDSDFVPLIEYITQDLSKKITIITPPNVGNCEDIIITMSKSLNKHKEYLEFRQQKNIIKDKKTLSVLSGQFYSSINMRKVKPQDLLNCLMKDEIKFKESTITNPYKL